MKRKQTAGMGLALGFTLTLSSLSWAQVSSPEAREASKDRFAAIDTNRDGKLSAEEMLAQRRLMWGRGATGAAMTQDACLRVLSEGLATGGALGVQMSSSFANECKRMDKNNDNMLSWEEFAGPVWLGFKLMDFDGDGFLTLDEFAGQGLQALRRLPRPPQMSAQVKTELDQNIAKANALRAANPAVNSAPVLPTQQVLTPQQTQGPTAVEAGRSSDSVYERVQNWFR